MELRNTEDEIQSLTDLYFSLQSTKFDIPNLSLLATTTNVENGDRTTTTKAIVDGNDDNDDDGIEQTTTTAVDVIRGLDSFRDRINALRDTIDKFRKRLTLRDPITDKPRYGEQTAQRVLQLLQRYQELDQARERLFGPPTTESDNNNQDSPSSLVQQQSAEEIDSATRSSVVDSIRQQAAIELAETQRQQEEQKQHEIAIEQARIAAFEQARREQMDAIAAAEQRQRAAVEAAARQAAEARLAAQRAHDEAAAADRAWVNSIPHRKTLDGVREQLKNFAESTSGSGSNMESLNALHTIFSQIVAHPEEVNYRRIRRDHPRFYHDIGQYAGGKEILIAAGFELGVVEEIPSFVCKEPDVEKDLDGWSAWFDLLKGTVSLIEEEMIK